MRELIRQKIVDSQTAPVPEFTRRDVRLPGVPGKAVAVIGTRRAGKTTLLWQVLADRVAQGVAREGLLYFSFEDERLAGMAAADLNLVVEEFYRLNPEWRDTRRALFLLDEIQGVPGWETFARRLLDTENIELFVSGSSAKLLSREVATSMRGRAMEATVFPFSFREYLRHHGREPQRAAARLPKASRSALEKDLRDYLAVGGFPEAQGIASRDRFDLLRGYVDVMLLRDVIERHAVSHPVALRWLVRQLLGNAAGAFSVNKFYSDLKSQGIPVAKDTLHAYLAYLEDAFLIRIVSLASNSVRRRMVNPRKVYPIDPGLIPVFDRSDRTNVGHILETCVFLELERRGAHVSYVRTADGYEVDFLARYPDRTQSLIQPCAELDDPDTMQREVRALLAAAKEHRRAGLHLITLTPEVARGLPERIVVHSAAQWLLADRAS
ncbi:MAG: ATP-binding protein [Candidatus Eisenbacteria sp.]|nr:ATP-binding protein [Candidatus Eisenbacteria bacterium]